MPNGYRYEDVLLGFVRRLTELKAKGELVNRDEASLAETARGFAHELEEEDSTAKYCTKCGTLSVYGDDCENCERMGFTTDSFFPPDWELPDVKISELPPTVKRLHELLTKSRLATARAMGFYNDLYGAQDEGVEKLHAAIEKLAVDNSQLKELLATSNDLISVEKGDLQAKIDELETKLAQSRLAQSSSPARRRQSTEETQLTEDEFQCAIYKLNKLLEAKDLEIDNLKCGLEVAEEDRDSLQKEYNDTEADNERLTDELRKAAAGHSFPFSNIVEENNRLRLQAQQLEERNAQLEAELNKAKADCTKAGSDYWHAEGEKEKLEAEIASLNKQIETWRETDSAKDSDIERLHKELREAAAATADRQLILDKCAEFFPDKPPGGFSFIEAVKQLKVFVENAKEVVICAEEGTHAYDCSATKGKPMDTPRGSCTCLSVRASQLTAVWPQFS